MDGQLAFDAPADGSYDVQLVYPRRYGLALFSLAAFLVGLVLMGSGPPEGGPHDTL
jgi:hypothetical protein